METAASQTSQQRQLATLRAALATVRVLLLAGARSRPDCVPIASEKILFAHLSISLNYLCINETQQIIIVCAVPSYWDMIISANDKGAQELDYDRVRRSNKPQDMSKFCKLCTDFWHFRPNLPQRMRATTMTVQITTGTR